MQSTRISALLMKARPAWNHDVFFDYCDRWMDPADPYAAQRAPHQRPDYEGRTYDPFVTAMWKAYRARVPDQPLAGHDRMWVYAGGEGKWVPNAKPTPEAFAKANKIVVSAFESTTSGNLAFLAVKNGAHVEFQVKTMVVLECANAHQM